MYDVIIVGSGPAGLAAAYNIKGTALLLDRGKSVEQRTSLTSGWGGAGCFSDGKLIVSDVVGGNLYNYTHFDLNKVIDFFKQFSDVKYYPHKPSHLVDKATRLGMNLVATDVYHLGTDGCLKFCNGVYDELKNKLEIHLEEKATYIEKEGDKFHITTNKGEYYCKYLILATGRSGSEWLEDALLSLGLNCTGNEVDLGVRVEVRTEVVKELLDFSRDFKLIYYTKYFEDKVRTFCYSDDTEILTDCGWKYFKDLQHNEKVVTLNSSTNEIEYQLPISYISYEYNGEMIRFNNHRSVDLLVMPEHNMWISIDLKKWSSNNHSDDKLRMAKDVPKNFKIPRIGKWIGKEEEYFYPPAIVKIPHDHRSKHVDKIPMDAWLRVFGIWIAEGSLNKQKGSYFIQVASYDDNNKKTIAGWIRDIGFTPYITDRGVCFVGKQIYTYLKQFGHCRDKFIPREILNLSSRQLNILFDAMYLGDGCQNYGLTRMYYTTSSKLAGNVQELALKIGVAANINITKLGCYIISMYPKPATIKQRHTSYVNYNGVVYCVEVPNHIIYVRRNGRACWCGNCVNQGGYVIQEESNGLISCNGHSFSDKQTENTNFALLVSIPFSDPIDPIQYSTNLVSNVNNVSDGVIVQRYGDLLRGRRSTPKRLNMSIVKPTLLEAYPGDCSLVLPFRYMTDLVEMLEAMNGLAEGVAGEDTLLYALEVKSLSNKVKLTEGLETEIPNLFAIGDGAGVSRGIVQATASGFVASKEINKRINGNNRMC